MVRAAIESLEDEIFAARIYRRLALMRRVPSLRAVLLEIASMEERHVKYWRKFSERRVVDPSEIGVSRFKVALYAALLRLLGLGLTPRILEMDEREAVSEIVESPELSEEERAGLAELIEDELVHEQELAREESRLEELLSHVRDAVLGMNDGLVEVLSVTAGLVGAYGDPFYVAPGGLVVGAAGAVVYVVIHEIVPGIYGTSTTSSPQRASSWDSWRCRCWTRRWEASPSAISTKDKYLIAS